MVKFFWRLILLVFVAWPGLAAAEVRLTVKADKKESVLGEPLMVEVRAEDVREPLSSISLDKLKQNFNVYSMSSNVQNHTRKGRTVSSETMTLTLYPLRSGKLQLPALSYSGKNSQPLMVSILESGKQTSRVIIKTALDAAHPQVRQAATLTLDIYDDGSLQWTAPREIVAASAHQRRLAESQREEMVDGARYTVHHYAWALMPLREGGMTVEFPLLEAFKFGTRLRYAVAPLWLNAAPVASYLPVYVPVGELRVSVDPLPAEIALNRPVNWTIKVQGSGLSEEGVSKLLSAMRSNEALRFYPPTISDADKERPTSAAQTLLVTLPFVPLQTGDVQLPEINLPYYDAAGARVESVVIPGARIIVFNPLWHTVQKVTVGLLVLVGIIGLVYGLFKQLRRVLKRRKSLFAISNAASAVELQRALLNFNTETSALQCLTLQQWLQRMQLVYGIDERLAEIVQKLTSAQYGADVASPAITELAHDAARLLHKLSFRNSGIRKRAHKSLFLTLFQPPARALKK
jgi:hypothetical protein